MKSTGTRIAAAVVAVALVVVLFFAFKGDDDGSVSTVSVETTTETSSEPSGGADEDPEKSDEPTEPAVPTIVVVGGQPKGGVADLTFDKGNQVRFVVESDTADEIHIHGYDIEEEVPAGGSAKFDFTADIDGIYEVELHSSAAQIAELTVNP